MDPLSIALMIAQAAPSIIGLFQKPYNQTQQPTNINPYSDQAWSQITGDMGNLNNMWMQAMANSQTAGLGDMGQSRNLLTSLQNVNYDPMAAQRQFMSEVPGLQNMVRSSVGESDTEQAMARMRATMGEDAASRFGGSPTGSAFQQSVMRAGIEPEMNFRMNRENQMSQMMNSMLGQRMNNLEGSMFNNAQFQSNNLLGGAQGFANLGGMSQQQAMGMLGQVGGQLNQTRGLMGQFGQPTMWSPDMMNNPNYVSPSQAMNNFGEIASMAPQLSQFFQGRTQTPPGATSNILPWNVPRQSNQPSAGSR